MADISKMLESLSPEKRRLLELKLKQQGKSFNTFPLSYAQQRLWFIDQLEPGSPAYNIPFAVRLSGKLNTAVVEKSLHTIIDRHEILRTTFSAVDGKGMQIIHKQSKVQLEQMDLSDLAQDKQDKKLISLINEKALFPFNLSQGPLGIITLIKLGPDDTILLLVMHHIISDGWSMGVLIGEFAQLYQAFLKDEANPLPPLKIQYADFAKWQIDWLKGGRLEKQLKFWKDQLRGHPSLLSLPTDKPRPAINRNRGDNVTQSFSGDLLFKIRNLSKNEGCTSFMTLLAAFNVLLYRYAGQDDICLGIPIANRNRPEIENLIGFFVNTLVIRTDLSGNPSFRELLQKIKSISLNAYSNQDLPFELIVEELHPERNMSYTPIFQVMFSHQVEDSTTNRLPGLTMSRVEFENPTSKFDLLLNLAETSKGLHASLDFNTDLFHKSTIGRMLRHFGILLGSAVTNPDISIDRLSILEKDELVALKANQSYESLDFPREGNIARLFEKQAEDHPDLIAAFYEGESLSYAELNRRANQLARYLVKHGLKTEDPVGILMHRSLDMIIALIAILKAGGAYLPVDPTYPPDRIDYMVNASGAKVVIVNEPDSAVSAGQNIEIINMKNYGRKIESESPANLNLPISPMNLAYVIYTSGSTGRPKGVMIQHYSALNLAENLHQTVYAPHGDRKMRISLNAPISFDASVQQIVMLTKGHALYILPQEIRGDGPALVEFIVNHKIEIMDCVPAQLRLMIANGLLTHTGWKPLALLPGGEAIDPASWSAMTGSDEIKFFNMYGPTECTVDSTIFDVKLNPAKPVIGYPVKNTRFYILDAALQPCPVGVPGELCISGDGLGRGYLGQPDLTAEKFIPDAYSDIKGARLYRTGDLARFLEDGKAEFLGRIDHQVKVRGFRIELGEVEAALEQHTDIRDAVVIVKTLTEDDKRIFAFIVCKNSVPEYNTLKNYLSGLLPDYMIPSKFIPLDRLPLNPSGKVDRKALMDSGNFDAAIEKEFIEPETSTQKQLAAIFSKVLSIERVSISDNFFDLGGHSLLATQLLSRIKDTFKIQMELRAIFEFATLEGLAGEIEKRAGSETLSTQTLIQPVSRSEEIPLSFAQQRLWFFDQMQPGDPTYNIPSAYKVTGKLDQDLLQRCVNTLVIRHESLRTTIRTTDGTPRQIITDNLTVPIQKVSLNVRDTGEPDQKIESLIREEARKPFDLSGGPLLRCTLISIDENYSVILLTIHHIISDGWSQAIIIKEIATLYQAFKNNRPDALKPLTLQYADFAHWQRRRLQGEVLANQIGYWKKQLGHGSPPLQLPTDRPRPATPTSNGWHYKFHLSKTITDAINALAQKQGATQFMILLAAFKALLFHYSKQEDISIGTPVANRNRSETENMIGFFVNTLVLRSDLSNDPTFKELVRQVRTTALGAYEHQDIPFEKLVDAIQPERNVGINPLFQVMFALQNIPNQPITMPDLKIETLDVENSISPFDLTLILFEENGGLTGSFEYNTDLFDLKTIERFTNHFKGLLQTAVTEPDAHISNLIPITESEKHDQVYTWNNTDTAFPEQLCLHRAFEEQARKTPDHIAVIAGGKSLSYRELDKQANKLAHHLISIGIGPENLVGLNIERSVDLAVALLGILKSGAAFLPLDVNFPWDRIDFMIHDAGLRVICTQDKFRSDYDRRIEQVVCLDADRDTIAKYPESSPDVALSPFNAAYVIYTSGSTGIPKGVVVNHQSVINHNFAMVDVFGLTSSDRMLQFASINFDGALEEIFPTWFSGGTLVMRDNNPLFSVEDLLKLIRKEKLTALDLPTAFWHEWAYERSISKNPLPESLRLIILGGDKANHDRLRLWNKFGGDAIQIINTYGPTEATIVATLSDLSVLKTNDDKPFEIPIGRPIRNTKAYILDPSLNLLPIGAPGELHLGGIALARGYLNRPDLTAERFVPDPFSGIEGARLYKTGDLVRYRPDGTIDFLGRVDRQVKIRGFRVELGEIESCLRNFESIRDAIVIAREDAPGDKQLAAYFIAQDENSFRIGDLRQHIGKQLPAFMIPSSFTKMAAFPLTPTGKIDRRALPKPEQPASQKTESYTAPRTEKEKTLAEVWSKVLGKDKIGINDNFFELGGDSILSIQLIARAKMAGIQFSAVQLFQHQTIAELTRVAQEAAAIRAEQGLLEGSLPLTPIQHWFFEQNFPAMHHWNQSILLGVNEQPDPEIVEQVCLRLQNQHDALRIRFIRENGQWRQFYSSADSVSPFVYHDLTSIPQDGEKAEIEEKSEDYQASLNLANGPVWRMVYFDFGKNRPGRLLIIVHHLVMDAVSWRNLFEDIQALYRQLKTGTGIELPPKTTSFKYWSERLSKYAESEKLRNELAFWNNQSARAEPGIPVDFPNGNNTDQSTGFELFRLSESYTKSLLEDIPKYYNSQINDALLAALVRAFGRWIGRQKLLIELEGHGREELFEDTDISRTTGWFTTLFPVKIDLTGTINPGEALNRTKEQLNRIPNKGIGYGILKYLYKDEEIRRQFSAHETPPINFNYLGQMDQVMQDNSPFTPALEFKGHEHDPSCKRSYLFEISGSVSNGCLTVSIGYSQNQYRGESIQKLAGYYKETLEELIGYCKAPQQQQAYTPTDFKMANLNQAKLDKVLGKLGKKK